jgi:hypothetical protein
VSYPEPAPGAGLRIWSPQNDADPGNTGRETTRHNNNDSRNPGSTTMNLKIEPPNLNHGPMQWMRTYSTVVGTIKQKHQNMNEEKELEERGRTIGTLKRTGISLDFPDFLNIYI